MAYKIIIFIIISVLVNNIIIYVKITSLCNLFFDFFQVTMILVSQRAYILPHFAYKELQFYSSL